MMDLSRPVEPPTPSRRDWYGPSVVAMSLLVHGAAMAPLLWPPHAQAARPPAETVVEVVQAPPPEPARPPSTKPAATAANTPDAKPSAKPPQSRQAAETPAPKRPEPHGSKQAHTKATPPAAPKPPPSRVAETGTTPPSRDTAERMRQLIGPMPAMVMPSAGTGDSALDDTVSYRQLILSRVAQQKREDRHDGVPAHAVVAFLLGDRGEVVTCEVREKSVDPKLDAEAVAMVHRGAPYPPPPPGAERAFSFGLGFRPS